MLAVVAMSYEEEAEANNAVSQKSLFFYISIVNLCQRYNACNSV